MSLSLFFSLYCLEAGLFFVFAPWTRFWGANPLVQSTGAIGAFLLNSYVRGFFSGIGFAHIIVGIRELLSIVKRRRQIAP